MSLHKDTEKAVKMFKVYPKTYEDLEYLSHFIGQFEDIGRYFRNFSLQHRFSIIDSFKLQSFTSKQSIFRKGDPSSYYYFVLDGQIEAYNEERDGSFKLVGTIGRGKSLGEMGILRNQPRSLTCIAKTNGHYLLLSSEQFMTLLGSNINKFVNEKIKFIEAYFPNVRKLTSVQKQRIAYAMGMVSMSRGQTVSKIGENLNFLYFIRDGELSVLLGSENTSQQMVLKLAPGNIIGEEAVFYTSPLRYKITVFSEYTQLYTLSRQDIFVLLPPETIDT